jgi:hypothetical protein
MASHSSFAAQHFVVLRTVIDFINGLVEVRSPVDPAGGADAVLPPEPVTLAVKAALLHALKAMPEVITAR